MSNDVTTSTQPSRPALLSSASNDYLAASLDGRCDQVRLAAALRTLLGLYFVPNETEEERVRQIALFIADLSDMSEDNVWWAMREWRRNNDRRPSPASLRQLCMMRRQEAINAKAERSPRPEQPQMWTPATPEQLAHRAETFARIVKSAGFVRDASGQLAFPPKPEDAPKRIPHWTETAAPDDPRYAVLRQARAENALARP